MYWKQPKDIHVVYEALSAIADNRVSLIDENHAVCFSTSGNKYYEIQYDPKTSSIMSNDNMAYYVGEISYPMIAYLLITERIEFNNDVLTPLNGIKWKDINQKNKNNYMKSVSEVLGLIGEKDKELVKNETNQIWNKISKLKLKHFGELKQPSNAY